MRYFRLELTTLYLNAERSLSHTWLLAKDSKMEMTDCIDALLSILSTSSIGTKTKNFDHPSKKQEEDISTQEKVIRKSEAKFVFLIKSSLLWKCACRGDGFRSKQVSRRRRWRACLPHLFWCLGGPPTSKVVCASTLFLLNFRNCFISYLLNYLQYLSYNRLVLLGCFRLQTVNMYFVRPVLPNGYPVSPLAQ